MNRPKSICLALLAMTALAPLRAQVAPPPPAAALPDPAALKWDADTKEVSPKAGDVSASFNFVVTNGSDHEVMINKLSTSCGCTVAQLPSTPYKLEPGSNVSIAVTLDLRGKFGTLTKTVSVDSSAGVKSLIVRANLPQAASVATTVAPVVALTAPVIAPVRSAVSAPVAVPVPNATGDRAMNIQNALADRQAVFKGDCATCHVDKGVGKMSAELYTASCGICHEAEHRAAMVPDLRVPRSPRDLAFWQKWITEGKPGTLMPAFAAAHGGSLTQEQVNSLTIYLYQNFPAKPPTASIVAPNQATAPSSDSFLSHDALNQELMKTRITQTKKLP